MLFYVIVYDISCDKRRKKVSDLLEGYGQGFSATWLFGKLCPSHF